MKEVGLLAADGEEFTPGELRSAASLDPRTYYKARDNLIAAGMLTQAGDGNQIRLRFHNPPLAPEKRQDPSTLYRKNKVRPTREQAVNGLVHRLTPIERMEDKIKQRAEKQDRLLQLERKNAEMQRRLTEAMAAATQHLEEIEDLKAEIRELYT